MKKIMFIFVICFVVLITIPTFAVPREIPIPTVGEPFIGIFNSVAVADAEGPFEYWVGYKMVVSTNKIGIEGLGVYTMSNIRWLIEKNYQILKFNMMLGYECVAYAAIVEKWVRDENGKLHHLFTLFIYDSSGNKLLKRIAYEK